MDETVPHTETIRWIKLILFMHVNDNIRYINCIFVQIRTGCCGNFFIFVLTPGQYSGERLKEYWSSDLYKSRVLRGMNYKAVIMMGKLALRLCLISYYATKQNKCTTIRPYLALPAP